MSVSVAVCGATGTVGSAVLIHLQTARLLKAGDRLVLVGADTLIGKTEER